jgi:hypothetical protein
VAGEQGPIPLVERKRPSTRLEGVKCHALTV